MAIQLSSPAFVPDGTIPTKHTCEGDDVAPALEWSGIPDGTASLALIVDDPDAPSGVWVHWIVYDLPPETRGLPEGGALPAGAKSGRNDSKKSGYSGPCPPAGSPHHYHFKLYALGRALGLEAGASKADLEAAMEDQILDRGTLIGRFGR